MKKAFALTSALALGLTTAAFAGAGSWDEAVDGGADAGDGPFTGFQSIMNGGGPVTTISGSMDWFNLGDHVDAYKITIKDAANFLVTTNPAGGGSFLGQDGFEDDSRLFLFDLAGNLVMANDDSIAAFGGSLESTLANPATWTANGGALNNAPGTVVNGQDYVLAVSYFENNITDGGGNGQADFTDFDGLQGQNPLFAGAAGWDDPGDFDDGWTYTIALTGASGMSAIPTPGALALLGLAGLAGTRRRRNSN